MRSTFNAVKVNTVERNVLYPMGQRITVILLIKLCVIANACHSFAVCDINYIVVPGKSLCLGHYIFIVKSGISLHCFIQFTVTFARTQKLDC